MWYFPMNIIKGIFLRILKSSAKEDLWLNGILIYSFDRHYKNPTYFLATLRPPQSKKAKVRLS